MSKKLILLLLATCMLFCLSACGKQNGTPKDTINSDIENLVNNIDLQNCFDSEFVNDSPYQVESNLIKRQTNFDNKEDIVYYDVIVKNDYFQISNTYKLLYRYYDEGGWILDDSVLESKNIIPIKAPEAQLVLEEWGQKQYYLNNTNYKFRGSTDWYGDFLDVDFTIVESQSDLNENGINANVNVTLTCSLTNIRGYIPLEFDSEKGWGIVDLLDEDIADFGTACLLVTDIDCDYSAAEGEFVYENGNEKYTLSLTFDEENGTVNTLHTINSGTGVHSMYYTNSASGVPKTMEYQYSFNCITGNFTAFKYYDSKNDAWIGYRATYNRK